MCGRYLRIAARLILDRKSPRRGLALGLLVQPHTSEERADIILMPNLSFVKELGHALAAGSDQDVTVYLQGCKITVELWRHKPKRQHFAIFSCSSYLRHQSLGLSASTINLQPDSVPAYGKPAAGVMSDFGISGIFELNITRRKVAETLKPAAELGNAAEQVQPVNQRDLPPAAEVGGVPAADEAHWHADKAALRTELDMCLPCFATGP
jgi:hypothetical protein